MTLSGSFNADTETSTIEKFGELGNLKIIDIDFTNEKYTVTDCKTFEDGCWLDLPDDESYQNEKIEINRAFLCAKKKKKKTNDEISSKCKKTPVFPAYFRYFRPKKYVFQKSGSVTF